jgi:hypothetical protein
MTVERVARTMNALGQMLAFSLITYIRLLEIAHHPPSLALSHRYRLLDSPRGKVAHVSVCVRPLLFEHRHDLLLSKGLPTRTKARPNDLQCFGDVEADIRDRVDGEDEQRLDHVSLDNLGCERWSNGLVQGELLQQTRRE